MRKTVKNEKRTGMHGPGFTLVELLIVIAIISILTGIAAIPSKQWLDKYRAEAEIKMMHTDLLQARSLAMQNSRYHFVVITATSYQIYQDRNNNTVYDAAGDAPPLTTVTLRYPISSVGTTITVDQGGLLSAPPDPTAIQLPSIFFNTGTVRTEFDCIQLFATRITLGLKNGGNCVAR